MRTASSLGASFTADELAVVLDRPVALVVDPLERATQAGLVAPGETEWRIHESAARTLVMLGRPGDAITDALASVATGVREAWATALAAIFRLFALDLDGARDDALRAVELEQAEPDPWAAALGQLALGMVYNSHGFFVRAIECCDRGVEIADASPGREVHRLVPHVFRAMALVNASRTEEGAAAAGASPTISGRPGPRPSTTT